MAFGDSFREGFWLALVMPIAAGVLIYFHQPWLFVIGAVGFFPLIDAAIGREKNRVVLGRTLNHEAWIPCLFIVGWLVVLAGAMSDARGAAPVEICGLMVACGLLSGMSMAHSHELMHRADYPSRAIADLAFIVAGYPHYRTVHHLHHANLGNPLFGSTAAVGTSAWQHFPRSFMAAAAASIAHEAARTDSVLKNVVVRGFTIGVAFSASAFWFGRWREITFCAGYVLISVFLVETIGYMQHYGLNTDCEPQQQLAAWDVDFWLSNRMFANNGCHTCHHLEQTRTYRRLVPATATMPGGYFHMLWVALLPVLWFSMMDRRVALRREDALRLASTHDNRSDT
jgi:alkane 1-monooxygenase